MVLAYFPQNFLGSVTANTNFPPQSQTSSAIPPDWFDVSFKSRIPLTVNSSQVIGGSKTDFQLLIDSTFSQMGGKVQAQGQDIRFAGTDMVQLPYEIEAFDGTSKLTAWTKKTIDTGTIIYMYFNKPSASDEQNSANVWDVNNLAVWHLNQTTFGANSTLDSTQLDAANNLTPDATPPIPTSVAGKPDGAVDFDGVDNDSQGLCSNAIRTLTNGFTLMAWVNPDNFVGVHRIFSIATSGGFGFGTNGSSTSLIFTTFGVQDYVQAVTAMTAGVYTHVAVKLDSSNDATFYVNGVNQGTVVGANPAGAPVGNYVLGGSSGAQMWLGEIGEFRIYNSELSDDLIQTIFNNETIPDSSMTPGFYTIGGIKNI